MDGKIILQGIALVGINGLAFVYDGQYIPMAIGIDALVLGVNVHSLYSNLNSKENGNERPE